MTDNHPERRSPMEHERDALDDLATAGQEWGAAPDPDDFLLTCLQEALRDVETGEPLDDDARPDLWVAEVRDAIRLIERLQAENAELRAAVKWYGDRAKECRLIHSGGDAARHELQADGGKFARQVLGEDT